MTFLCDADVDGPLVRRLRDDGHDVSYMTEIKANSTDEEVLALASGKHAVLITRDKGFGRLVFQQGLASSGVLLIRLAGVPMADRAELLSRTVQQHGSEFIGAFSVLTPAGLRIRPRLG
ncbi:MAG: DUF5615 family PIN-like protein [Longimicrobiales bacterium]